MAKRGKGKAEGSESDLPVQSPRSLAIAAQGIETAEDFAKMMSSLMSDMIDGRVTPQVGNATCNAGGKLLRVVELQYKYGTSADGAPSKDLRLVGTGKNR